MILDHVTKMAIHSYKRTNGIFCFHQCINILIHDLLWPRKFDPFFSHNKQKGSSIYGRGPSTHFLYGFLSLCDNKNLKLFYNKQKRLSIYKQEPSAHFFYSIVTFHLLVAPLGIGFTQDSCSSNEQIQSSIFKSSRQKYGISAEPPVFHDNCKRPRASLYFCK